MQPIPRWCLSARVFSPLHLTGRHLFSVLPEGIHISPMSILSCSSSPLSCMLLPGPTLSVFSLASPCRVKDSSPASSAQFRLNQIVPRPLWPTRNSGTPAQTRSRLNPLPTLAPAPCTTAALIQQRCAFWRAKPDPRLIFHFGGQRPLHHARRNLSRPPLPCSGDPYSLQDPIVPAVRACSDVRVPSTPWRAACFNPPSPISSAPVQGFGASLVSICFPLVPAPSLQLV